MPWSGDRLNKGILIIKIITGVSKPLTGLRAELIRISILFNIALLAFSSLKNPLLSLKVLKEIKAKRRKVMGLKKIRKFFKSGSRYFFSDDIPGWPSAAFNRYFLTEIIRASGSDHQNVPLSTVFLSITSRCSMRCRHCYEWENLSKNDFLSLTELKEAIRKFKNIGVRHFQLCGGEPLERMDDLVSLLAYSGKGSDLWINTSGFGLTYEKALLLKKAGLTGAEISLDHWDASEHNQFRGHDKSFFWAREAARSCADAGILTGLSICATANFVTKENLRRFAYLAMDWDISFIRLLEPRETVRFKGEEVNLSAEQIEMLEEFFLAAGSPKNLQEYPVISYPGYNQRRTGCSGAGIRYLYVDPRGDIHACPFCRNSAGNVVTGNIEDTVSLLRTLGCQLYKTSTQD